MMKVLLGISLTLFDGVCSGMLFQVEHLHCGTCILASHSMIVASHYNFTDHLSAHEDG